MRKGLHKKELRPGTVVRIKVETGWAHKNEQGYVVKDNRFRTTVCVRGMDVMFYRNEVAVVPGHKVQPIVRMLARERRK